MYSNFPFTFENAQNNTLSSSQGIIGLTDDVHWLTMVLWLTGYLSIGQFIIIPIEMVARGGRERVVAESLRVAH